MPITEHPGIGAQAGLAPEAQALLLSAAGPDRDGELRALLDSDLNEAVLLRLVLHERAAFPLWRRFSDLGLERHPAFADVLRRHAMIAGFRQQELESRMRAAIDTLGAAGCRTMLLKGAALALTVYDSFADRPMGDVDLLVPEAKARSAFALLLDNGWHTDCTPERLRFYEAHHHLPRLQADELAAVVLELHTAVLPRWSPFSLRDEELWDRSRTIRVAGSTVHVPATEHALLHLCIHFVWSHLGQRRGWLTFRDLHALLGATTLDWGSFCRTARRTRAASCCYWTLRLAASLSGLRVPAEVLQELRPPGHPTVLNCLETHFAGDLLPSDRACPSARVQRAMWELAIRPAWSGHGAARPWDQPFTDPATPARPDLNAVPSRARNPAAWRRYVGALVRRRVGTLRVR